MFHNWVPTDMFELLFPNQFGLVHQGIKGNGRNRIEIKYNKDLNFVKGSKFFLMAITIGKLESGSEYQCRGLQEESGRGGCAGGLFRPWQDPQKGGAFCLSRFRGL